MGAFQPHGGPITRAAVGLFSPSERADLHVIERVNEWEGLLLTDEFVNPDEHQIRLASELNDTRMLISDDDQMFSALWLNRSSEEESDPRPLLIAANGFLASVVTTDGKYRAYHLARQFPDHQIIVYDQPGHGYSSPFTEQQRKDMSKGDMQDVGNQLFSAIRNFAEVNLGPVSRALIRAESFGSRGALDLAIASKNTELEIERMVLLELSGTEGNRRVAVHASYFGFEFLRSSYYGAGTYWWDAHKAEFEKYIANYSGWGLPPKPDSFFIQDWRMAAANFYNSVLGHGNGLEVLKQLVRNGVTIVRSTAEKGQIDRMAAAEAQRREMLWEEGKAWGQIIMLHESHDGTGFAPRARIAAALSRFALEQGIEIMSLQGSYHTTMERVQNGTLLVPKEMVFAYNS